MLVVPKLTLGWEVIDWIETYLVHGPGDVEGEEIELTDEQAIHILCAYEIRPDGRRIIRRDFLSRPKGWAKSEFAGMLCCVEALGPVRFDGFDSKGKPVGKPIRWPFIRCLATEEDQSGNTYDNVRVMLEHVADKHGDTYRVDPGLTRTFIKGGGEIVPSTAANASKDGGKETFVVFDETHLYETPELRRMHATVRRNMAKRKAAEPWSLETSTMYRPGFNSVAETTHEYARSIEDGRRKDLSLLFDHREAPDGVDWSDDKQVLKALPIGYGDASGFADFERILAEFRDPDNDLSDLIRYFGNKVVRSTESAFDVKRWKELATTFTVADKDLVVLGFDGARNKDSTALVGTHLASGYQWLEEIWERPPDAKEDWLVDKADVDAVVQRAFDTWEVWGLFCDPPYWEEQISDWKGRFGDKRVFEWWTNRTKQTSYAVRAFVSAIRTGELTHDGDSRYARHIANARRKATRMRDEDGSPLWVIEKEHPNSPNKIDAAMAGVLSWEARLTAIANGALRTSQRSKKLVTF